MFKKQNVIYTRFSSELQRNESIEDQERRCRQHVRTLGIPERDFIVLADKAIPGTRESRPAFDKLKELLHSGRLGILIVTEQSRLSRGDDAKPMIKDIVFCGGRFLSITEGIDTTRQGWELQVGISQLHHSAANADTASRVRAGQEGRVRDGDGSAGDYPPKPLRAIFFASRNMLDPQLYSQFAVTDAGLACQRTQWTLGRRFDAFLPPEQ